MIYTEMTKKAMRICYEAHKGQLDKGGCPYVFHPYHLAEQMQTEETVITALLHDVVEDTSYTFDDLRKEGFSENVIKALMLLTHDNSVPYEMYIQGVKMNDIAKQVKLADLRHNSDVTRLAPGTVNEQRMKKYAAAIGELTKG